jgi:hypothetical protein
MMLKGHTRRAGTGSAVNLLTGWRPGTGASFAAISCPSSPSLQSDLRLNGEITVNKITVERLFADYRRKQHR